MIPLSRPLIGKEEINAVESVLKSGRLSLGEKTEEFEKNFANFIGTEYAVATSSGTSGLHLCMRAIDLKESDEVITTPFSFISSANCILFERAKPVFADIDEKTFNMDPEKIEDAVTERTKAILPVHIFGQPSEMDKIMQIAKKRNLKVIEDACESIGAEYNGRKAGKFGLASVFAFYPNKQITTGEGGMICTDSRHFHDICKSLRNQGRSEKGEWLDHRYLGYNYRLNEMSCALGIEQLKKIKYMLKKRNEAASEYTKMLKDVDGVRTPFVDKNIKMSWFVYVVRLEDGINRDGVIKFLLKNGIESRPYFPSIHLQPLYREKFGFREGDFPVCESVSNSVLALPFYTHMEKNTIHQVCETLEKAIKYVRGKQK
ncbi:MAG: DegT/DnrJ/EryC1/StrS family aminotransferase [Candidatus Aenigmatarchaeota archaeon]|nr:MAG: DegT/DnrJ/EryC1/StrS family aminotransferase [Candidatus Aenigmarchaeota archaeon]